MNSVLRYATLSGLFSILFIPLIVSSSMFFPFITGKNFTFRIIVEVVFALWLILALRDENYRPQFSWILASFASFVAIIGLADLFGENPAKSIWSNFERMEGLVTLLHLFAYFVVLGSVMRTSVLWRRLFNTSLFVSFIACIYGFVQLSGGLPINQGGVRVDATFGNATYLAIYMVIHIFLAIFLLFQSNVGRVQKGIYGVLILCQSIILYHTATRGAILGLIGGLLLTALILAIFERKNNTLRRGSLVIIGGIFAFILVFLLIKDSTFVKESPVLARFANISWNETKTQARSYVWPMAIKGFAERPILGWGQENFNYVFNKYYDPRMYSQEPWFDRTHNIILDWLIAGGLLGLLGYLSLYFVALYAIWKKGDLTLPQRSILTGVFAAYFFNNIFVFDNITSYVLFIILLSYLHFDTAKPFTSNVAKKISYILSDQKIVNFFVAPAVLVLMFFSIYFFNAKAVAANTSLIQALTNAQGRNIGGAIDSFKKALSYHTFGDQEIREQLMQLAFLSRDSSSGLKTEDVKTIFDLTKTEYEKMIQEAPNDTRHRLFLGQLLDTYGYYGDGLEQLKVAHTLSPKKQSILFEMGASLISAGKYADAMTILKEAFDLEQNYDDARIMYAVSAIYAGNNNLVKDILVPRFGTVSYPSDQLLRAYFDTKQFTRIVEIWENQVKAFPNNARFHAALGSSYYQVGRMTDAVNEITKARDLETDATTKAQYQGLIDSIKAGRAI